MHDLSPVRILFYYRRVEIHSYWSDMACISDDSFESGFLYLFHYFERISTPKLSDPYNTSLKRVDFHSHTFRQYAYRMLVMPILYKKYREANVF